jgi:hypothetical protein
MPLLPLFLYCYVHSSSEMASAVLILAQILLFLLLYFDFVQRYSGLLLHCYTAALI